VIITGVSQSRTNGKQLRQDNITIIDLCGYPQISLSVFLGTDVLLESKGLLLASFSENLSW